MTLKFINKSAQKLSIFSSKASFAITLIYCLIIFDCASREITFFDLVNIKEGETISIKGFVIKGEDGNVYLSSLPNVKSCCLNSSQKLKVFNIDLNTETKKAIRLEGVFKEGALHL